MASEKKMQIENKFFNRAFGELPNSQCELNQLPPEESEKAKYKEDIPGNHKIIPNIESILNNAPPLSPISVDVYKENNTFNIPVRSAGCASVSTGSRRIAPPKVEDHHRFAANTSHGGQPGAQIYGEDTPALPSMSSYNMMCKVTNDFSEISSCSPQQSQYCNIRTQDRTRTVCSSYDNQSFRVEEYTHCQQGAGECGFQERFEISNRVSPPEGASGMPQDDIFIINLKLDIIKLLQHKLEISNGNGWQELAALRGWDYSRTRDFENRCHMGRESPFRSLLLEHEFQLYTLRQLKYDLDRLPRKDILHALDKKMKELYH